MAPAHAPAENPGRRDRILVACGVFLLALGVRLLHLALIEGSDLTSVLMGDARSYDTWARTVAAGDWLGQETFYQAPLYPYALALVYAFVSPEPVAARVAQCLLGAASCVLLAGAGWRFVSRGAGIASGVILALYTPALFADTTIQKTSLVSFLLCALLYVASGLQRDVRPRACVVLGAVLGALVLARENALVFVPVLALWLLWLPDVRGAKRLVPAALLLVGLSAVLLPVALRNLHVGGEFHLTTSQFGPNFYIGNRAGADGTYAPLLPGRGDARYERLDATALAERAEGRSLSPGEVSRYFTAAAWREISADPAGWLRLLGRKLALTVNAVEVADTEDLYSHADTSLAARRPRPTVPVRRPRDPRRARRLELLAQAAAPAARLWPARRVRRLPAPLLRVRALPPAPGTAVGDPGRGLRGPAAAAASRVLPDARRARRRRRRHPRGRPLARPRSRHDALGHPLQPGQPARR